jgi:hypothetical protein
MLGIPFTIRRHSPAGVEDQVVYLRTHRCGQAGDKMRTAIRTYHRASFAQAKAAARAGGLMRESLAGLSEDKASRIKALEKIATDQTAAMDLATEQAEAAIASAVEVARQALIDNYGKDRAEEIVDGLTEHELHGILGTVEMGSMPKDFFPSPAIQPNPSGTEPSGSGQAKSS